MKDRLLQIRVDETFISKLEYLQKINGFKTIAETVRKIVEKEYRKENTLNTREIYNQLDVISEYIDGTLHPIVSPDNWDVYSTLYDLIGDLKSSIG